MTIHEQDKYPCPLHEQDLVPCPVHQLDAGSEPEPEDDSHYWLVEQEIRKEFTVFTVHH